jgi:hypothetical protein
VLLVEGAIVQVQISECAEQVTEVLRAALDALLKTGA